MVYPLEEAFEAYLEFNEIESESDMYDDLLRYIFSDYDGTGRVSCEYEKYFDKIHDLIYPNLKSKTYEHFISILITLEDYIYEDPTLNDKMKHHKYNELMAFRIRFINYMKNKNTIE